MLAATSNTFLERITEELEDASGKTYQNFFAEDRAAPANATADPVRLHSDRPANLDRLGRAPFAEILAEQLRQMHAEIIAARTALTHSPLQVLAATPGFMVHLHAPWGSGKTSFLGFLKDALQTTEHGEWIIVEFNAWQRQRLDLPWWQMMDALYRQGKHQLAAKYNKPRAAWKLWGLETSWRFQTSNSRTLVIASLFAVILLLLCLFGRNEIGVAINLLGLGKSPIPAEKLGTNTDIINHVIDAARGLLWIAGLVFVASKFLGNLLVPGSLQAAETFLQTAFDPMARLSAHFGKLVTQMKKPVAFFIDDLDRCDSSYVIKLMESIQTILTDERVFYIISADRGWLNASYEKFYADFTNSVQEPGRPLGSLFLQKAVQLSVSLPRISLTERQAFVNDLVVPKESAEADATAIKAEIQKIRTATDEQQIEALLKAHDVSPNLQQVRRNAAAYRLASESSSIAATTYFLQDFAPLLGPNPRGIKRLLNAYSLHRSLAIIAGISILENLDKRKQLVLWTIISLRWPVLEDYLAENPSKVTLFIKDTDSDEEEEEASLSETEPADVLKLRARSEVLDVFRGKGVDVPLTEEALREFLGLRTSNASAATVS